MKKPTPAPILFIRSFEAAARHRSFTRAAEELGCTQAAVSSHVRSLEKYTGRTLFVRHARSLELTEVGEAFLPTLRDALQQIDAAAEAIVRTSREQSVVLACPMSLAESWLPPVLAAFRRRRPDVEVLVQGTVWDRPGGDPADIVIAIHRGEGVPSIFRLLIPESLVLVCAPTLAAAIQTPEDIGALPQIHVAGRQEYFSIFAQHYGLDREDPVAGTLRTNASNIALQMAMEGLGVTISLRTLVEPYLRRGLLVAPFSDDYRSPWHYYMAVVSDRPSTATRQLVQQLEASARTMKGDSVGTVGRNDSLPDRAAP